MVTCLKNRVQNKAVHSISQSFVNFIMTWDQRKCNEAVVGGGKYSLASSPSYGEWWRGEANGKKSEGHKWNGSVQMQEATQTCTGNIAKGKAWPYHSLFQGIPRSSDTQHATVPFSFSSNKTWVCVYIVIHGHVHTHIYTCAHVPEHRHAATDTSKNAYLCAMHLKNVYSCSLYMWGMCICWYTHMFPYACAHTTFQKVPHLLYSSGNLHVKT